MNNWLHENTHWLEAHGVWGVGPGEQLATREHAPPGCTRRREGQPLVKNWLRENAHILEAHGTGSALGEQLAMRKHAQTGSTRCGEGQPLVNNWLHENTHNLEAHDAGRVSPWRTTGYARTRTNWGHAAQGQGQTVADS